MAKTKTFTVAQTPTTTPVTTQTVTRRVIVQEDPSVSNWPTTDFAVRRPASTDVAIQRLAGTAYIFETTTYFAAGQIVGYLSGISGSSTFQQDESGID